MMLKFTKIFKGADANERVLIEKALLSLHNTGSSNYKLLIVYVYGVLELNIYEFIGESENGQDKTKVIKKVRLQLEAASKK